MATTHPRTRDLGLVIGPLLSPGKLNAITDVPRVKVGMVEKISGDSSSNSPLIRAGLTLIGTDDIHQVPLFAGVESLQPFGEVTGSLSLQDSGQLDSVIAISGTQEVGAVHSAIHRAELRGRFGQLSALPVTLSVVAETYDRLSAPLSFPHIGDAELEQAIKDMNAGPVREGNTGGGTPMVSYGLKGGTGTSSRIVPSADGSSFTVGALVQANHGVPYDLTIGGVAVGKVLYEEGYNKPWFPSGSESQAATSIAPGDGSIIVVIATDAPLLPHQCKAVARRAGVGISRGGGGVSVFSGDIFLCFSTAAPLTTPSKPTGQMIEPVAAYSVGAVTNSTLNAIFRAAADATEEAILNALLAADELDGYTGQRFRTLPVERVKELLREAGKIPADTE